MHYLSTFKQTTLYHKFAVVMLLLEPAIFVLREGSLDLTSPISCNISCFQDQDGSFKARMEFRQTSRVPPSCKRTCMHVKYGLED